MQLFEVSIGLWIVSEVVYRFWSPAVRWLSGLIGLPLAAAFGILPNEIWEEPGEYWWFVLMWIPGLLAREAPAGRRRSTPWFWVGCASFLLAYQIWLTGTADHEWCSPDSVVQAHAVWHLLSALATWAFFKFLRTERVREREGAGALGSRQA